MVTTGLNVSLNIFLGNKTRCHWRALIHFKTKHKIGITFFPLGQLSACGFSDLFPKTNKKHPNPQGKENPKWNLMRQNEIGNQVLIFSKIILNNFFVDHVSSCDCFPFLLLPWRWGVLMIFVFFEGVARVKIAGIIRKVGGSRPRHAIFFVTCNYIYMVR